jgi:hypothetical protein
VILIALGWFVIWAAVAALLLGIGWATTSIVQGRDTATALATVWLFGFNGILAGAAGYGVVFFLCWERHTLLKALAKAVLVPESLRPKFDELIKRVKSWPATHAIAVLLTMIGGYIAYGAGIVLDGFAHVYLTLAVFSFYFAGAYGLMVIVAILRLFRFIETDLARAADERIQLRSPVPIQDVRTIDLFFVVSSAMSMIALYVCFRGTLTAFATAPPLFYKALIIPLLFFLPAVLVYSFYPRYVLRLVWEADTLASIERFEADTAAIEMTDLKTALEYRKLILDVKEKTLAERKALPILSFKDAPTLTLGFLMAIQLIVQKDPVIARFLDVIGR